MLGFAVDRVGVLYNLYYANLYMRPENYIRNGYQVSVYANRSSAFPSCVTLPKLFSLFAHVVVCYCNQKRLMKKNV
jgi:hypothetical protein